jgi:cytochrome c-type biogenesis protein CcmH
MARRCLSALVGVLILGSGLAPALAAATTQNATARASLTDIENDVMCVSCREPLAVAQSPQADYERRFISHLIAQNYTKPQIERILVTQYGTAVLGKPPARGFNLLIYILPPAILVGGIAILAVTLPRWRRRSRAAAAPPGRPPALHPRDASRLEQELARYKG